ncbi:MAG TPA: GDSL-type esterase/lipase family protein [Bryobacteraceae bacterium]|nr:GDSL-type esterase/lipase family protein [Bryobacteraceae bacterium]
MPRKTALTVIVFAALALLPQIVPPLKRYVSFDPRKIPDVWNFPVSERSVQDTAPALEEIRAKRLQVMAPKHLLDPDGALDHFYQALLDGGVTRVLHYGDSPTTADLITADARALLQKEFGDAGTGFVLIAKPWAWYNHRGVGMDASSDWQIDVAGATELKDGLNGLGGASFQGNEGAEARWTLKDGRHTSVDISYLAQPGGGSFVFEADGKQLGEIGTDAPQRQAAFASFALPPGSKHFTLRVSSGNVRLFGADFRKPGPGVVYSSLGVNGANITLLSRDFNAAHWSAQLRHYKPDLVVLAYGTNESGYPQFVHTTWAKEMKLAVQRVQADVPDASILLMSPMDRGERNAAGQIDTIGTLPQLVKIEKQVAEETGTAFFDTFHAMGGEGTMARWYASEPRLVGADFIHPMPGGAKIVGELLFRALRDGYNQYKLRQSKGRSAGVADAPDSRRAALPAQ